MGGVRASEGSGGGEEVRVFDEQFGEVRSGLQGEPGQEAFEGVMRVLARMSWLDAARFEAEVFHYASAALERWYAGRPLRELVLRGGQAGALVVEGGPCLSLVRGLDLSQTSRREALVAALAGSVASRLEHLCLPDSLSRASIEQVVTGEVAAGLVELRETFDRASAWVEALVEKPLPRLRRLELGCDALSDGVVRGVLEGAPALEVLSLRSMGADEALCCALLEGLAARGGLRELRLREQTFTARVWDAMELLSRAPGLEVLEVSWLGVLGAEGMERLYGSRMRGLRSLRLEGQGWRVDRLLGSELGQGLGSLSLSGAAVSGAGASSGSEALEVLRLEGSGSGSGSGCSDEALRWFGAGRWPALRELSLSLGEETTAVGLRAALGAELPALRRLRLDAWSMRAGWWYMLWSEDGIGRLAGLESLEIHVFGELDEALDVEALVEVIEGLPALRALYFRALRMSLPHRGRLVGTRVGELLGLSIEEV
jgi:hypothetical protein